ncbi:hypothetical protein SAMN05444274_1206 [Mariniphaga anaerophila]|uniref:Uncharacterized protein n=1 Tax=Mariniphaga anaerophila TaxID=1484053 RepID=A0A1M5GEB2_9BACT|nr:hypothetical protein [Mariniphaga anaerophila]SHG02044.1 hypothetical protein SAMN05444274_1206 [Mariniphaga anaerophila]
MEKSILLLSVLLLTLTIGFCQDVIIMTEYPNSESVKQENKSEKFRTYYFHDTLVDSTIFSLDSIQLFKNRTDRENSRLELFNDSRFLLVYNIELETVTKTNAETGEGKKLTVQSSDEIGGKYGLLHVAKSENEIKDESLRFILKNDTIYDFEIIDKDNQILLIKKKKYRL